MPVVDFELKSLDAERFGDKKKSMKNVRVDHNSSVIGVKKLKKDIFDVTFRFTANYSGLGRIEIEGKLKFKGGPGDLDQKWSDDNQMPNQVANEIHSTVISNCIPEAVFLARDIQLPPPIPLPKVNIPGKKEKKKPKGGMEVA
ncbi:MAG: hypothetical protein R6U61_01785 [Thermoplasmata archaeon]